MDYVKRYPIAMKAIAEWIEKGLLKRKFHIVNGLDAAPSALPLLYSGGNTGKLCFVPFAWTKIVSHLASPGSSRFPGTKPHPSFDAFWLLVHRNFFTDIRCNRVTSTEAMGTALMHLVFSFGSKPTWGWRRTRVYQITSFALCGCYGLN